MSDMSKVKLMNNHLDDEYYQLRGVFKKCLPSVFIDCTVDNIFNEFVNQAALAVFMPQFQIVLKQHTDEPISYEWIKIFETKLDLEYVAEHRIQFQSNSAKFYDNFAYNVLWDTSEFQFLSYYGYELISRNLAPEWLRTTHYDQDNVFYELLGAGQDLVYFSFELTREQKYYYRRQMVVWDLMAWTGGFAVALFFIGRQCYGFVSQGSDNALKEKYMKSQY